MNADIIILIITNILVPIVVALIGLLATRKYKKDLAIQKQAHEYELEKMKMQYDHQIDLIKQQTQMNMTESLTQRIFDEALSNEDVKREIHKGISSGVKKKR